ncbi:MAG: hypothetical protein RLZZ563_2039 [Pseudomonadota bacterium]|jgi:hypothetical protein
MKRVISATALVLSLFAAPAVFASDDEGVDAATQEKLTTQLVAEGYEVRQFKAEDGLIEVYVVKDGKMEELFFNAKLELVEHEEGDEG